ncbi:MAG: hypothetical protein V2I54_01995 [Bacteroidales bacterium]|jgi:hypothetical protein|nr:hypothetical protein [Bacteroidales bacterium]
MKPYHYKRIFFFLIICSCIGSLNTFAQNIKIEAGKSAAMSNISVTLTDLWSIYYNQAALDYVEEISIGAFHQSGFIKQQNIQGIGFAFPTRTGTVGATYSYFGFSQYNEMEAGLAFGRTFSRYFSVGLKINYLNTHIADNYGSKSTANFEVGILSHPLENLSIGIHVYNPSRSMMNDEAIPTIFKLGMGYSFSEIVFFAIETEKDLLHEAIFKAGLDYQLIDRLSLQAGISTNPTRYSFGIGFQFISLKAHVGFINHQTLGFTPSFTLSYGF